MNKERTWFDMDVRRKVLPPAGDAVTCMAIAENGKAHMAVCRIKKKKVLGLFTVRRWELVRWVDESCTGYKLKKVMAWKFGVAMR